MSTGQVALRCHLPMFVLPCPDYAIREAGAGSLEDNGKGRNKKNLTRVVLLSRTRLAPREKREGGLGVCLILSDPV